MPPRKPYTGGEVQKHAKIAADEIGRLCHLSHIDNGRYRQDEAERIIRNLLGDYETFIAHIIGKATGRERSRAIDVYNEWGAMEGRIQNIRTWNGYGMGCDICHGSGVETFMIIQFGSYKARVMQDLCRKCTERMAAVIDARLEDRRIRENRKAK